MSSIFVAGGRIVGEHDVLAADVLIEDGRVTAVGPGLSVPEDAETIDASGKLVFPGLIDSQVHFREPGLTHKGDLESESLAAVAGGITSFCEMPNTKPNTVDPDALVDKLERARHRAHADHAFFLGATAQNADQLGEWEQAPGCAGVKVFMGSSTGTLLVPDDATLERVLRSGERRVAVHSEDEDTLIQNQRDAGSDVTVFDHPRIRSVEAAVRATTRLLDLVEKTRRKVHVLHISTAEEVAIFRERDLGELVTAEATPNHLFMCAPECYERWGSLAQMNPPVRDRRHQEAIRQGAVDGVISVIGSDHAPHTADEKAQPYPHSPSGIPGVQTTLPLLLTAVRDGWLQLTDIVRLLVTGPIRAYGIANKGPLAPGVDGDVVIVDPDVTVAMPEEWLRARAKNPFVGTELAGWPVLTVLRGQIAYRDHQVVNANRGEMLRYA